jgi:hypothetical protein
VNKARMVEQCRLVRPAGYTPAVNTDLRGGRSTAPEAGCLLPAAAGHQSACSLSEAAAAGAGRAARSPAAAGGSSRRAVPGSVLSEQENNAGKKTKREIKL